MFWFKNIEVNIPRNSLHIFSAHWSVVRKWCAPSAMKLKIPQHTQTYHHRSMKASKHRGSSVTRWLSPLFPFSDSDHCQRNSQRLVLGLSSNTYLSVTHHPPSTVLLSLSLPLFCCWQGNKRRHVHRECGSVCLSLCLSVFFFRPWVCRWTCR